MQKSAGTTTTTRHAYHMVRIILSQCKWCIKKLILFFPCPKRTPFPRLSVSSGVILQVRYSTLWERKRYFYVEKLIPLLSDFGKDPEHVVSYPTAQLDVSKLTQSPGKE